MPAKLTKKQIQQGLDQVPIDVLLLGHKSNGLTHKQKEFAKNVALGDTGADAYRKAYRKGKPPVKPKVAGNRASDLKQNEGIALEIEAIKQAIEFNKAHSTAQLRALVVSQLTKEALNDDNPPASRLTALKALGEVAGVDAFIHRTETKVIRDSDTAKHELMEQLKKMIGDNVRTINEDDSDARELLAEISGAGTEIPVLVTPQGAYPQDFDIDGATYIHSTPHNQPPKVSDHEQPTPLQEAEGVNINSDIETPPSSFLVK